mgnify:CR=1 FL=1
MSRCVLTETYSPAAMDSAPASSAAPPAVAMTGIDVLVAATPTTTPAVETMPSFAPSTPARSRLSREPVLSGWWGSPGCRPVRGVSLMVSP